MGDKIDAMSERAVDQGRRLLCQAACATGGLIALSTVPGCGGGGGTEASCSAGSIGVGDAKSLAIGEVRYVESQAIFICRDAGGYFAMDAACTHIGTDLDFVSAQAGFKCPLHFSTFDFSGHVTAGPAMANLPHYSLCTTDSGLLIVDTDKRVTADTRLVV